MSIKNKLKTQKKEFFMDKLEKEINDFLNNELLSTKGLSNDVYDERCFIEDSLSRIFLRRFRKYATTQAVKDFVKDRLTNIVNKSLPLRFVPSFGGYKHWWSPTYPKTDWAEVFNVKFLLEYLAPIYNSYKKEVSIEYESEEVILAELNNIPQDGLDAYTESFRDLLRVYQIIVGKRVGLSLVLAREQYAEKNYTKEMLLKRIEQMMPDYYDRFDGYEEDDRKKRLAKVKTNFKINGVKDYSNLNEEELNGLYRWSRVFNEAFLDADYEVRGESFFDDESTIPLLFSFGLGPGGEAWPHIGSSSSSMVDFWAGMGILEKRENGAIVPRIISKTQYDLIKDNLIRVDVKTKLSGNNANYDYIYVYKGTLVF